GMTSVLRKIEPALPARLQADRRPETPPCAHLGGVGEGAPHPLAVRAEPERSADRPLPRLTREEVAQLAELLEPALHVAEPRGVRVEAGLAEVQPGAARRRRLEL